MPQDGDGRGVGGDVADEVLGVERGDGLGPDPFAAAGRDFLVAHGRVASPDDGLDHGPAKVDLGDDRVGLKLVIGGDGRPRPCLRR